jgi:putative ABC transport system permease protein
LHWCSWRSAWGTLVLLLLFTTQWKTGSQRDARTVDLVVGAKGSPLQLILSSVLHVDVPTGNIPLEAAAGSRPTRWSPRPRRFPWATPTAVPHRGHRRFVPRAVFRAHRRGAPFREEMEAVLGSEAARQHGARAGRDFVGSHGLAGAGGAAHGEHAYKVVGILAPTGTVVDRARPDPLESVWEVHGAHGAAPESREITALLVRYRTPIAAAQLPRRINATTAMQAASPAYEGAAAHEPRGRRRRCARIFAAVLMASAALSVFIALSSALQERRHDLALLRLLGAPPARLFALVAAEGMTLVVSGVILGLVAGHAATHALGQWLARSQGWSVTGLAWAGGEAWLVVLALVVGAGACAIPAILAYRRDPATVLLER